MNPIIPPPIPHITPPIWTVSSLNQSVAQLLERGLALARVSGEVSNFTRATSGHWYFTLKDDQAQVRSVMFKGRTQYASFIPRDGDKVEVRALVTLYAPRGEYQLNIEAIRPAGIGDLYDLFIQLKEKLFHEGLFHIDRKRPLPLFVKTIGIITSPQAAALHDVLITLKRRASHVRIILYPCAVQGKQAAAHIIDAIHTASNHAQCDALILCRGGGSMEDLWCFNDEALARAMIQCPIPIISGIGHETDTTIADFVSDVRAATPTAAAELAITPRTYWLNALKSHAHTLTHTMRQQLTRHTQNTRWIQHKLISPQTTIARKQVMLHHLSIRLTHALHTQYTQATFIFQQIQHRIHTQKPRVSHHKNNVARITQQLLSHFNARLKHHHQSCITHAAQLNLLNPQRTLERGYAILTTAQGRILRSPNELHAHQTLIVQLAKGAAHVTLEHIQPDLGSS